MIEYVFAIDGKPRISYSPAKYSKYQAYRDCKEHYTNHFVSYVGKHCDDNKCDKLNDLINNQVRLTTLKDKLFNEINSKLPNLDYDTRRKLFLYRDLVCKLNSLKLEIRQLELCVNFGVNRMSISLDGHLDIG